MPDIDYIIVGRDVGEAQYHLVGGSFLDASTDPGGTPLDVIHIGKLIARMSEREGAERCATEHEIEQIKRAMQVVSVPPGQFAKVQEDAIWAQTDVEVLFETRTPSAAQVEDNNKRILVVPADGTLKAALDALEMPNPGDHFDPPLTYPVDKNLMLGHLLDQIVEIAVEAPEPCDLATMSWTDIKKHFADRFEAKLSDAAHQGDVDQVGAYHRAVGIYATNMCR